MMEDVGALDGTFSMLKRAVLFMLCLLGDCLSVLSNVEDKLSFQGDNNLDVLNREKKEWSLLCGFGSFIDNLVYFRIDL